MADIIVTMRGWDPVGEQYVYWLAPGFDDTGGNYTGPPVFGSLIGVCAIKVVVAELPQNAAFWPPFETPTQDPELDTTLAPNYIAAQFASREDYAATNTPPLDLLTLNPTTTTSDDVEFTDEVVIRSETAPAKVEYLGAPNYYIHELTLANGDMATRVDQKLMASTVDGAVVVADAGNVRQMLNQTNSTFDLRQTLTTPPTFSLANRAVVMATTGDAWLEANAADCFLASTATARFSFAFEFEASTAFAADATLFDSTGGTGRGITLEWDNAAGAYVFTAYNSSHVALYSLSHTVAADANPHTICVVADGSFADMYFDDMTTAVATNGTLSTQAGSHQANLAVGGVAGGASGRWNGYFRGLVFDDLVWPTRMRLEYQLYTGEYVIDPAQLHVWDDMIQYETVAPGEGTGAIQISATGAGLSEAQTRFEPAAANTAAEYDAADLSSLAVNDDGTGGTPAIDGTIGRWIDQTGDSTADARQTVAGDRPIRSTINGRPSIEFVSDDFFDVQNLTWFNGLSGMSVLVVGTLTDYGTVGEAQIAYQIQSDGNNYLFTIDRLENSEDFRLGGRVNSIQGFTGLSSRTDAATLDVSHSLVGIHDAANDAQTFRVNGIERSQVAFASHATFDPGAAIHIRIGGYDTVSTRNWIGHIERIVCLSTAASAQEVRMFEASKALFHSHSNLYASNVFEFTGESNLLSIAPGTGYTAAAIEAWGGGGGGAYSGALGGGGAFVAGTLAVSEGDILNVDAATGGGRGGNGGNGPAGQPGGGEGNSAAQYGGGGGGGYSAVSRGGTYYIVAGGGGGAGTDSGTPRPDGGGAGIALAEDGDDSVNEAGTGGGGATDLAGGAAGTSVSGNNGFAGAALQGGDAYQGSEADGAGGGGGGWFGGGGGANDGADGAAGGGGSSYIEGSLTATSSGAATGQTAGGTPPVGVGDGGGTDTAGEPGYVKITLS